ncbi:MAG: cobyrinate a,c-diamide synthase [Candidatus Desulfatibia sp.]|uniref:cobyrinate a,c-diamide synthase n=1 Tax=Candidatus Desulfatibia sp. TaxID=3101189 RepID=UPI002F2C72A2
MDFPRILIAALRGGSGKTLLSIGIIAAWKALGKNVTPFKKGPDYIDAGWLTLAAGRPCHNLDTFLIETKHVLQSFLFHSNQGDIAVVEGNRGLYDGFDIKGSTSTAELAKLLHAPVVLCIDCTKSTRTMAAAVLGCMQFDPGVDIKGVILNRVAGPRHEQILRKSIEHHCNIPVLGAVPKLGKQNFPERHMGLIPTPEHAWAQESIVAATQIATNYLDLVALERIACLAPKNFVSGSCPQPTGISSPLQPAPPLRSDQDKAPRIGIIKDSAFQFYYPENIEALVSAGAEPVFISPLTSDTIPPVDALYIGGGFPETHAQQLSANVKFREQLKFLAQDGLPIYAECGGLMYLGEELVLDERSYPMAGVLPAAFGFSKKPQGHGYTIMVVKEKNPYFEVGAELRGHEFHYSRVLKWRGAAKDLVFDMQRGTGFIDNKDGVCYKNVLATYTHLHALGSPSWAEAMLRNAMAYKNKIAGTIL